MVGFKSLSWLSEPTRRRLSKKESPSLGILAFETAKTMSRLVSLYKSLSDEEISRLKNNIIKSEGVAFLNSKDEGFLLSLACAERLEDLDRAAAAVSRLGKKCVDFGLNRFDLLYTDLKLGIIDFGKLKYGSRSAEKKVGKMVKLVSSTLSLQAALEALTESEILEKKFKQWKSNFDLFNDQKIENQRKEVHYFRKISLWSKTFDESVDLMARIVCILYARICTVFRRERKKLSPIELIEERILPHSAPLLGKSNPVMIRFYSRKFDDEEVQNNRVFHAAGPSTAGGCGLALRYADVILSAEKLFNNSTAGISREERDSWYQMLPENVKSLVRIKLSKNMKWSDNDAALADGWRAAVGEMMGWLAPMAHDTLRWRMERNFEKMNKFDDGKKDVLLLQTLHFSDIEKTEAAIAEVLVGLSCVLRFEKIET